MLWLTYNKLLRSTLVTADYEHVGSNSSTEVASIMQCIVGRRKNMDCLLLLKEKLGFIYSIYIYIYIYIYIRMGC